MPKIIKIGYYNDNIYDRLIRIKGFDLDKISCAKVLVVGAGALGNEVCKNLVLSGYKNITIVDMDHIVKANLNRCLFFTDNDAQEKRMKAEVVAERLRELSEDINMSTYTDKIEDLGEDFIRRHGMVIGCLDNIAARLHLNANCYYYKIPYVDGGTLGMSGKVQVVIPPSSCIQCGMNKTHMKVVQMRFSCTGEETVFFEPKLAAEITTTSIIAAVQVREALKITNKLEGVLAGKMFYYDGIKNTSEIYEIEKNPECDVHEPDKI